MAICLPFEQNSNRMTVSQEGPVHFRITYQLKLLFNKQEMCPTPIYNYHSSFKYIQFTTKYMLILYDHLL